MGIFQYPKLPTSVVKSAVMPKISMQSSRRGRTYVLVTVAIFNRLWPSQNRSFPSLFGGITTGLPTSYYWVPLNHPLIAPKRGFASPHACRDLHCTEFGVRGASYFEKNTMFSRGDSTKFSWPHYGVYPFPLPAFPDKCIRDTALLFYLRKSIIGYYPRSISPYADSQWDGQCGNDKRSTSAVLRIGTEKKNVEWTSWRPVQKWIFQ